MKRLLQKFEDIMVAVTFAEAGEYELARKMSAGIKQEDQEEDATEEAETA